MHVPSLIFSAFVLCASVADASPKHYQKRSSNSQTPSRSPIPEIARAAAAVPTASGAAAVMGDGTYPRATILSDGSLLGVFTAFSDNNAIITTVKSTDSGSTWSALGTVVQGPTATKDIDNGYVHQLSSGRVLCAFRNHDKDSTGYTFYRITVSYSDDNGATWKYLSTVTTDSNSAQGDWEPFMMDALDGSLMIFYSHENNASDQDSMLRRSTDGGATWSDAQTISGADVIARDGMIGATRTAPSSPTIIAVFESGVGGLFSVHSVKSTDDGNTWGDRSDVYIPPTGKDAGAPQVTRVGSSLVASFMTNEDSDTTWPDGAMKFVVSSDGGVSWGSKTVVHDAPAYWPGLLTLEDDASFLAMYESGQSYAQKFVF